MKTSRLAAGSRWRSSGSARPAGIWTSCRGEREITDQKYCLRAKDGGMAFAAAFAALGGFLAAPKRGSQTSSGERRA